MLPVLECCNVDCALYGNHEFGESAVLNSTSLIIIYFYRLWS